MDAIEIGYSHMLLDTLPCVKPDDNSRAVSEMENNAVRQEQEEQLQHKIFYLAKAPNFILKEVFRKEYTVNDNPESREASPICDLHQLMGDLHSFLPGISLLFILKTTGKKSWTG